MQYEFDGIPQALSYGQNIEVSVKPEPESAVLQLWKCDEKGNKQAMLNTDIATPASGKKIMQFKIPPRTTNMPANTRPASTCLSPTPTQRASGRGQSSR